MKSQNSNRKNVELNNLKKKTDIIEEVIKILP